MITVCACPACTPSPIYKAHDPAPPDYPTWCANCKQRWYADAHLSCDCTCHQKASAQPQLACPCCTKRLRTESIRVWWNGERRIYLECADCNLSVMLRDPSDDSLQRATVSMECRKLVETLTARPKRK